MFLHLVEPEVEEGLGPQGHHHEPGAGGQGLPGDDGGTSPDIDVLLGVLGGGQLHDVLDKLEGLVVHVVCVCLVPHVFSPAAGDTEEHDGLGATAGQFRAMLD